MGVLAFPKRMHFIQRVNSFCPAHFFDFLSSDGRLFGLCVGLLKILWTTFIALKKLIFGMWLVFNLPKRYNEK